MTDSPSGFGGYIPSNLHDGNADIPEEHDTLMAVEEPVSAFPPPPRIAARFYRRSQQRRRSSAASSRRNSISSAHSHHSHHSYHGPQSNHVAQHLRRASILESRKARLADRAAHAEKVRLRAALAKAAPRVAMSEERALAAEKARHRYLAQVAAACSEEVKRAKRVAEEMKERREAEGRKLRIDMEERLAEAERRRFEYQRHVKRVRTTSVPRTEEKKVSKQLVDSVNEKEAALIIQHAWRAGKRKLTVGAFIALGLSVERVRNTEFEEIGELLSRDDVLIRTAEVLRLCGLQDHESEALDERTAVRTFLSAYLILGHPAHVLSQDGEQERDLVDKSKDLQISFETLLSCLDASNRYTPPPAQRRALLEAYSAFRSAFSAWKAHDSSILLQTMLAQYVELDQIWQTIKADSEEVVKAEYRSGIRENQILVLVRIKRLAGPEMAKKLIRDAVRKARRDRQKKSTGAAASAHPQDVSLASASSNLGTSTPQGFGLVPNVHDVQHSNPYSQEDPSKANHLAKIMTVMPENRVVVHELAINKHWSVDPDDIIDSEPRRALGNMLFDDIRAGIRNGEGHMWIAVIADSVRSQLLALLTPGNSLHVLISETLDPLVMAREWSMGNFSYDGFFSFMNSILPRLCAPFRDPDVKALAETRYEDDIDRLAALLRVINLMTLDYMNYKLQQVIPMLLTEARAYEETCFREDLEKERITLARVVRWWSNSREKVYAEANRRDPEGIDHPSNRPTWQKIYMQGLTDLFFSVSELQDEELPDTLLLDEDRIIRIRNDSLRIVAIGSVLLTAKNLLKRDVRTQWRTEAARMWDILRDDNYSPAEAANIMSLIESSYALPPATRTQLCSMISRVMAQSSARQLTDPLMRLLLHRIKTYVPIRLMAATATDRVRSISGANEDLIASVLPEFVGRVGETVEEVSKVGHVDRAAHGRWYDELAARVDGVVGVARQPL